MAYIPTAHNHYCTDCACDDCERRTRAKSLINRVLDERQQHDAELVRTAIHESAHAVVAMLRGHELKSLAIDMSTGVGECYTSGYDAPLGDAIVSAAGIAADAIMDGGDYRFAERTIARSRMRQVLGYSVPDDVASVRRHLSRAGLDDGAGLRKACDHARNLLERAKVWRQVTQLADMLLESGGFICPRKWRAPKGTLARKIQRERAGRKALTSFERLMKNNEEFWRSEGCL